MNHQQAKTIMSTWNEKIWREDQPEQREKAYLGNGLLGLRVGTDPFENGRLLLSGFWGELESESIDRLVDLPSNLGFNFGFEGVRGSGHPGERASCLDMKRGALVSKGSRFDGEQRLCSYETRHWVSRDQPSLVVMEVELTAAIDGDLICAPMLDLAATDVVEVEAMEALVPGQYEASAETRLLLKSRGLAQKAGVTTSLRAAPGALVEPCAYTLNSSMRNWHMRWKDLKAGDRVGFVLHLTAVSEASHPQPLAQAVRMRRWAFAHDLEELRASHEARWEETWKGRVVIEGDHEDQAALDGSLYHLFCSASEHSISGMAPFGLSGNGYHGHTFWDCETWTYPPFVLLDPLTAKRSLEYRLESLPAARKNASLHGFQGAMFPWESGRDGSEQTVVNAETGIMQHHVTADIAFAFWQYQVSQGDSYWMKESTWPLLEAVAQWVCSRVVETERGYEIHHVVCPDEHAANKNNNAFTNLACKRVLELAAQCAQELGQVVPQRWEQVAAGLVVVRDEDGLILPFENWTPDHHAKQADTLLAVYPFATIDDPADIEAIIEHHVPVDPDHSYTVAMGDQIHAVAAARVGQRELASLFFRRGWEPYWINTWGMFAETRRRTNGCFITGHGGVLQAALTGFTGLQMEHPDLAVHDAALPAGWKSITVERIHWKGREWRLQAVHGEKAKLTPLED